MTTSTTKESKDEKSKDDQPQGTITGNAKLDEDSRFKFGPPPIQTAEDATMAYLREEITEEEYRTALGKYGTLPGQLFKVAKGTERIDASFERSIPDDIYDDLVNPDLSLQQRLDKVKEADEEREKATKEAEQDKPLKVAEVPAPISSTTSPTASHDEKMDTSTDKSDKK